MLTPDGRRRWLELAGADLEGGSIVIGDGNGRTASSPITSSWVSGFEDEPSVLNAEATFAEAEAVFEWRERSVVDATGRVIDTETIDGGRKILGAVWTVAVELELEGVNA